MTVIQCPRCGKETKFEGNEFRPFCSERCKLIDFGAWADEQYSLPAEDAASEEDMAKAEEVLQGRKE